MSLRYFVSRQFHQIAPIGRLDANNFEDASSATPNGAGSATNLSASESERRQWCLGSRRDRGEASSRFEWLPPFGGVGVTTRNGKNRTLVRREIDKE
jgi:hypothetical protein